MDFRIHPDLGFQAIDVPDARATSVFGADPAGDIVGSYTTVEGTINGFMQLAPSTRAANP